MHTKTYLEIQGASEEVNVRLEKLSMEGSTIHWFNGIYETKDELTWSKVKKSLIEPYGGREK